MSRIELPDPLIRPVVACTPEELETLRGAWRGDSPDRAVVAAVVDGAEQALDRELTFPPRGGQHNQWYQCDACQVALRTLDASHHECPSCGRVYSGPPYDDVLFKRTHHANLARASGAAWAYAITGRDEFAADAADVLLGYAERYLRYPYHAAHRDPQVSSGGHISSQTLDESSMLARDVAPAYDLIHDALTDEQRRAIRAGLIEPMIANIDKNTGDISNWQTWHNAGLIWGGAAIGEAKWVDKAIRGETSGVWFQLAHLAKVSPEGLWHENSWAYHFYTLKAMVLIAEAARRLGVDVWAEPTLRKMCTLAPRYAMGGGALPRFGDDTGVNVRAYPTIMEPAWHACRDPAVAAALPDEPVWETALYGRTEHPAAAAEPTGSEVFPGAGHAILRTAGEARLAAAITFGPYGGFHGHYDKLSFVLYGWGRELGVDPGRAASQAYRLPVHTEWYKATLGHNAVLVDAASQRPATGELLAFDDAAERPAVVARIDEAYPGVAHVRALALFGGCLVVLDELTADGDAPHRFDWVYHNRGTSVSCEAAAAPGGLPADYPGRDHVQDVRTGETNETVHTVFGDGEVSTHVTLDAASDTQVLTGTGVGASVKDRVPMMMATRRGPAARFAAVIEPVPTDRAPQARGVEIAADGDDLRVILCDDDGSAAEALRLDGERRIVS